MWGQCATVRGTKNGQKTGAEEVEGVCRGKAKGKGIGNVAVSKRMVRTQYHNIRKKKR